MAYLYDQSKPRAANRFFKARSTIAREESLKRYYASLEFKSQLKKSESPLEVVARVGISDNAPTKKRKTAHDILAQMQNNTPEEKSTPRLIGAPLWTSIEPADTQQHAAKVGLTRAENLTGAVRALRLMQERES